MLVTSLMYWQNSKSRSSYYIDIVFEITALSFHRYATEVDVDFVRKSVRAIGRCAIKVDSAAERCVSTLVELIQTKVTYVVQEAVIVIKDIFRKYPSQYETIISVLCENLDSLDEPEARYSVWAVWAVCLYISCLGREYFLPPQERRLYPSFKSCSEPICNLVFHNKTPSQEKVKIQLCLLFPLHLDSLTPPLLPLIPTGPP